MFTPATATRPGFGLRVRRMVPVGIRAVVRYAPPRGHGIRLADAWTRISPPDATRFISNEAGGVRLQCDLRDHLSRVIYYRGWVDIGLERWMRGWLRPGDVYVDVGAHIGYLCALGAEAVGGGGRVVAFEPTRETFEKLDAAFDSARFAHVELVHAAVAADDGEASLFTTASGDWAHQSYRNSLHPAAGLQADATVPTVRLDHYFPSEPIRLIKVDVEGGEPAVLAGAADLLAQRRCDALVVELNPGALARAGSSVAGLVGRLIDAGYRAHRCRPDGQLEAWDPVEVDAEFADAVFVSPAHATSPRSVGHQP